MWWPLLCRSSLKACREQSLDDVAKSVCRNAIPLDLRPFQHMSPEGLDLLRSLLERDPVQRATAVEVRFFGVAERCLRLEAWTLEA